MKQNKKKRIHACMYTSRGSMQSNHHVVNIFPQIVVFFGSIQVDHTLSEHRSDAAAFVYHIFLCVSMCRCYCNNNTVAAKVAECLEWLWYDWNENGSVGDYDNSLGNISWHISWITKMHMNIWRWMRGSTWYVG